VNPHSLADTDNEGFSDVVWTFEFGSGAKEVVVAVIVYPAVQKFNGVKVAVFWKGHWDAIKDKTKIDPHFYEDDKSPCARFPPTLQGINMALRFAEAINDSPIDGRMRELKKAQELLTYKGRAFK
jgi:hypothetical protein